MRDGPLPVQFMKTNRGAPPHIDTLAVLFHSADVIEAMAERHFIARGDAQVADVKVYGTLER